MKTGTYLVTGGAGFLGSHLCDALLTRGHRVLCVDNFLTGRPANIAHLAGHDRFRFIKHDVSQDLYLPGPLDGVLHFASPASPRDYLEFPIQTLKVGALGTHKMLGLAKDKKARFLLASTSEVYGDPQVHPQKEDYWGHVNPVGPRGVYDEAKRFAEAISMAYHRTHGVRVRLARIFNTYGPRMRKKDGRAVPEFISAALAKSPLLVFGDGRQTRSLCYVTDEVEGLLRLLFSSQVGPMNIGNPQEYSIEDVARMVKKLTRSSSRIVHKPLPVDDPKIRQPDISLARRALKWNPTVSLEEGLRRTIAWFRAPTS
ncbi:MAG: SDR family oxidoreductase [Elusimicrobia bacterium]|jgi:dTDP-glucose 4,6-dehydratase|nr:SDR family oxidoreductase [Elusimicrobiota bacterium]